MGPFLFGFSFLAGNYASVSSQHLGGFDGHMEACAASRFETPFAES